MDALVARLLETLRPWLNAPAWRVGFSGGLDSTVLLELLARLREQVTLPPLSAIHVNHGLQKDAARWASHCQAFCDARRIPLKVCEVKVAAGGSVEAAARDARYAAFEALLAPGEILLAAQHRDDQAETVLFRLLRGAGVKGLGGMAHARPFGQGMLLRPLLAVGRDELQRWADAHGLTWVEDSSNQDVRFARNFLRQRVFPQLHAQWPHAGANLARAAQHLQEAQGLLDELAGADLAAAEKGAPFAWLPLPSLDLEVVRELSPARQRNLLRHWLSAFTSMPDTEHWYGWQTLRDARIDAEPCWRLAGGDVRRSAGRIWFVPQAWQLPLAPCPWPEPQQKLSLPGNGQAYLVAPMPEGELVIAYRRGGEVLDVPGRGRRDLKRLLNEAGVPDFVRGRLPLLYCDDRLVAVANLQHLSSAGVALVWEPAGLR